MRKSRKEDELGKLLKLEFPHTPIIAQATLGSGNLRLFIDYILPALGLAFETDGIQHSKHVPFFQKDKDKFHRQQQNDKYKEEMLEELGYTLIRFGPKDLITKEELRKRIAAIAQEEND